MITRNTLYIVVLAAASLQACNTTANKKNEAESLLPQQAVGQLWQNVRTQPKLVKVHAAEFLLWLGLDKQNEIHTIFMGEDSLYRTESPYRIPVWRVLAQTETDPQKRQEWIDKIINVWLDTTAMDRIHAAESLSKLKVSLLSSHPALTMQIINGPKTPFSVYTQWSASNGITNADSIKSNRAAFLQLLYHADDYVKGIAAYSLRHLGRLTNAQWMELAYAASKKLSKEEFQVYLLSAAFVTATDSLLGGPTYNDIHDRLLLNKNSPRKDDRMEMAAAFAVKGSPADIKVLDSLLNNKYPLINTADTAADNAANADIRSVAAYAILKIAQRQNQQSNK